MRVDNLSVMLASSLCLTAEHALAWLAGVCVRGRALVEGMSPARAGTQGAPQGLPEQAQGSAPVGPGALSSRWRVVFLRAEIVDDFWIGVCLAKTWV